MDELTKQINEIVGSAKKIVIIQADNPDADSLGSALALETILFQMGKDSYMYCGVDMPDYLKYLDGWDRVSNDLPKEFDASIIVDASTMTLLEKLEASGHQGWVAAKPVIVLDHHATTQNDIEFATVVLNRDDVVSTGELIYQLAKDLSWPLDVKVLECIMTSILGDSMGLTSASTTAQTYRVMAELVEAGVDRPKLEEQRRLLNKMAVEIYKYKAKLIERTELFDDNRIALVIIPQDEISTYSPLYNPAPLIQTDMLMVEDVLVAIVLKTYDSGRLTGAIRSNAQAPIAADLAAHFGGGGHNYASGFKIDKLAGSVTDKKHEIIAKAHELLATVTEN